MPGHLIRPDDGREYVQDEYGILCFCYTGTGSRRSRRGSEMSDPDSERSANSPSIVPARESIGDLGRDKGQELVSTWVVQKKTEPESGLTRIMQHLRGMLSHPTSPMLCLFSE